MMISLSLFLCGRRGGRVCTMILCVRFFLDMGNRIEITVCVCIEETFFGGENIDIQFGVTSKGNCCKSRASRSKPDGTD